MSEEEALNTLGSLVEDLASKVKGFSTTLKTAQDTQDRVKLVSRIAIVIAIGAILVGLTVGLLWLKVSHAVDKVQSTQVIAATAAKTALNAQVISCQNANDTREANKTLWLKVISLSTRGATTPEQKFQIQKFKTWIIELYIPHDCSQLDKKYPIPPAPDLKLMNR